MMIESINNVNTFVNEYFVENLHESICMTYGQLSMLYKITTGQVYQKLRFFKSYIKFETTSIHLKHFQLNCKTSLSMCFSGFTLTLSTQPRTKNPLTHPWH